MNSPQTSPPVASSRSHRKRLLVLASTYPRWPADPEPSFVHQLARRLVDRFDVTVLCPHAAGAARSETMDGVEVHRYRYALSRWERLVNDGGIVANLRRKPWMWLLVPPFLVSQTLCTLRLIRSIRPDVVHAHWLIPQGLVVAVTSYLTLSRTPYVVTVHGADLFSLRGRLLASLKKLVICRAAVTTVVSNAMVEPVRRVASADSVIRVEPMGVDLRQQFVPDPCVVRSSNEILFVGRLVEKKGLRFLIDALPKILGRHPSAVLTIVGFGPEEAACRQQVWTLGLSEKVRFLGAVPQCDLPGLYRRAAVFVAPFVAAASGDQEGLGLVVLEALGCGCPVVVSDLPAVGDLVHDGVPPGDSRRLAERIIGVLERQGATTGDQETRRGLLEKFDWESVASRYGELLETASSRDAPPRS